MNLSEYQLINGIRRINFDELKPTGIDESIAENILVCPYCNESIEYDKYEEDDIVNGTEYQCPCCNKWFYAEGEVSITTTCRPIEDKIIFSRKYIEAMYRNMDTDDALGRDFSENNFSNKELYVYQHYAKPLFENESID